MGSAGLDGLGDIVFTFVLRVIAAYIITIEVQRLLNYFSSQSSTREVDSLKKTFYSVGIDSFPGVNNKNNPGLEAEIYDLATSKLTPANMVSTAVR